MKEVGNPQDCPIISPSHGTTRLFMTDTIRLQIASPRITAMMIRPIHLRTSAPSDVNVLTVWFIILLPLQRLLHTSPSRYRRQAGSDREVVTSFFKVSHTLFEFLSIAWRSRPARVYNCL